MAALKAQADAFEPVYLLGREAISLAHSPDGRPIVTLSDGTVVDAGAVIVTAGIGTFTPRTLPAGEEFLDRGLSYFVPDPQEHADRDVLVVGGGDSAVDWALALRKIARSVTLVHRRSAFRAHAASVRELHDSGVEIITDAQVESLYGNGVVQQAHVRIDGQSDPRVLPVDAVVAALGFISNLGPLTEWGMDLDRRTIVVDSRMQTTASRVYAAATSRRTPGRSGSCRSDSVRWLPRSTMRPFPWTPRSHSSPGIRRMPGKPDLNGHQEED
ncbi:hypothetical protein GCM10020255_012880 [Rhodococcus baikonurensis]